MNILFSIVFVISTWHSYGQSQFSVEIPADGNFVLHYTNGLTSEKNTSELFFNLFLNSEIQSIIYPGLDSFTTSENLTGLLDGKTIIPKEFQVSLEGSRFIFSATANLNCSMEVTEGALLYNCVLISSEVSAFFFKQEVFEKGAISVECFKDKKIFECHIEVSGKLRPIEKPKLYSSQRLAIAAADQLLRSYELAFHLVSDEENHSMNDFLEIDDDNEDETGSPLWRILMEQFESQNDDVISFSTF